MESIVTSLTVDPDEVFEVQKSNIGIAISCPKEISTDQAFRSETDNGTFYVGDVIIPANGMWVYILYYHHIHSHYSCKVCR